MSAAVLADTNVLVYWMDAGGGRRHARAAEIFDLLGLDRVRLSTQVLSEFASVMTHPRKLAMEPAMAADAVMAMSDSCEILPVGPRTVVAALRAHERWQLAYFVAQIWASVRSTTSPSSSPRTSHPVPRWAE